MDLRIPVSSNRRLARRTEGGKCKNASTPRIHSTRGDGHYLGTEAEEHNIDGKPDTIRRGRYLGIFGEGTRLAMPNTRLHAGLIVIEAWFRGY